MSLKFLKELEIEKENDINEWGELEINFSPPKRLEIISPHLPAAGTISRLLHLIYSKLNYLFDYLDYQVVVREPTVIDKKTVQEYFSFICSTPFLWKDKKNLIFFCQQKELLENFVFRRNIVYLCFPNQLTIDNWKPKLTSLKEILNKLGLTNIRFASKAKEKEKNDAKNDNLVTSGNNGAKTEEKKK